MKHECRITVLETKVFPELQEEYLADPKAGACPFFKPGDTFTLKRTPQQDDFYHLMNGKFCGEAWDAISRYVYTALQGGSIMQGWTKDDRMMIACCNDGTRPVIFRIERIDLPESPEEKEWLDKHAGRCIHGINQENKKREKAKPAEKRFCRKSEQKRLTFLCRMKRRR